jgi:hypothetical protein
MNRPNHSSPPGTTVTDRCRSLLLHRLALAGCSCLWATAAASESNIVGPRSQGMGGVGVAATDDGVAQFENPAAFGFFGYPHGADKLASDNNDLHRKHWGVALDVTAGGRQGEEFADRLNTLDDIDFDALTSSPLVAGSSLVDLTKFSNAMVHSDDPGNALSGFGNAGATVRVWHLGLGMRAFGEAAVYVSSVDLTRVGLPSGGSATFADAINLTGSTDDNQILLLDPTLVAAFTASGATPGNALDAVQRLDAAARAAGVPAKDAAELSQLYFAMNTQFGANTFQSNQTQITARGLSVVEFPLTYGHPINDHLAVGGNLKLMVGRVYGTRVSIFDGDAEDQIKHADDNFHQSVDVGVDLGVMFRIPFLQVGLTGRNLNEPSFDGFTKNGATFDDVTVDRQVTLGVALIPWSTFVVEVDADVLEVDSLTPGYHTQNLAAGLEWNPWHFLALRAGLSQNLAESDVGPLVHAGLGFNFWAVRLDLAGAMSLDTQKVGDTDTPREAQASFGVAVDF